MTLIANNFEDIIRAFDRHHADFIIAGGYAVIFHGYVRTTGDLDLWVKPVTDNQSKVTSALEELDMKEVAEYLGSIDFTKPFSVKIGKKPGQVDVFNAITGIRYDQAEGNAVAFQFSEELTVKFIHLKDLITNKMLTGRMKDKADVEELQKIQRWKKDE